MLVASISKEKVKSLTVPRLFVIFSLLLLLQSSVIDKTQPICYAVIPLWFLILISLFESTVVTKENLIHLKNNSNLTTMSVSNENDN